MVTWSSPIHQSTSPIPWFSPSRTGPPRGIPPSWASFSASAEWVVFIHRILTSGRPAFTSGKTMHLASQSISASSLSPLAFPVRLYLFANHIYLPLFLVAFAYAKSVHSTRQTKVFIRIYSFYVRPSSFTEN